MNVIFRAVKFQANAADFADRSTEVIVKPHLIFKRNEGATILGGEDYVIKKIGVGVGYGLSD